MEPSQVTGVREYEFTYIVSTGTDACSSCTRRIRVIAASEADAAERYQEILGQIREAEARPATWTSSAFSSKH